MHDVGICLPVFATYGVCVCARTMLDSRPTQQLLITLTEKSLCLLSHQYTPPSLSIQLSLRHFSLFPLLQPFNSVNPRLSSSIYLFTLISFPTVPLLWRCDTSGFFSSLPSFLLSSSPACHAEAVVNTRLGPKTTASLAPPLSIPPIPSFLNLFSFLCHHILPLLYPGLTPSLIFSYFSFFLSLDQLD